MRPIERVLEHFESVERRNGYYMVRCKNHDDQRASVSVREADDGRVLVKDHGGCSTEDVLAAAGLSMSDLFPASANGRHNDRKTLGAKPTAVWRIKDTKGELQAVHVRFDREGGKECLWRLPGASGWGLEGRKLSTLPLYRSEHAGDWPEDVPRIVVEGEKAADALASVYPATLGTVTGASNTPGSEALEVLRGKAVILWADNDEEGGHTCGESQKPSGA